MHITAGAPAARVPALAISAEYFPFDLLLIAAVDRATGDEFIFLRNVGECVSYRVIFFVTNEKDIFEERCGQ